MTNGICEYVLQEWSHCITNSNTTSIKTNVSYKSQDTLNQNIQDIYKLLGKRYRTYECIFVILTDYFYRQLS